MPLLPRFLSENAHRLVRKRCAVFHGSRDIAQLIKSAATPVACILKEREEPITQQSRGRTKSRECVCVCVRAHAMQGDGASV